MVNWWFGILRIPLLKGIVTEGYPDSNPKPPGPKPPNLPFVDKWWQLLRRLDWKQLQLLWTFFLEVQGCSFEVFFIFTPNIEKLDPISLAHIFQDGLVKNHHQPWDGLCRTPDLSCVDFAFASSMACWDQQLQGPTAPLSSTLLGGGNSNIFNFHPENWGRFSFWLIFFKGVETTNQIVITAGRWPWLFCTCHRSCFVAASSIYGGNWTKAIYLSSPHDTF